jgi:hypothetical protein
MKVPLEGIDWASARGAVLETRVPSGVLSRGYGTAMR